MNEFVDSLEAAQMAGVSLDTLRLWMRSGKFPKPTHQRGRNRMWYRHEVEQAITRIRTPVPLTAEVR